MQKKIIVLAIASALTAPALALADSANVSLYGQANVSYDITNSGTNKANNVSSNASRFGLKGAEDLGNGLSAVWQMEGTVLMDMGTSRIFDRDTYAGLSSATAGTVILGNHDTPYKMATRKLDLFADSLADNRSLMGGGVHDARVTDVLAYISPNFNGMSVAAAYVGKNDSNSLHALVGASSTDKVSAISLAGMYDVGPLSASLAYQTISDQNAPGAATVDNKSTAFKLGAGYTTDAFAVGAVLERLSNTVTVPRSDTSATNIYLAGKYNLNATDAVKLAFTKAGSTAASNGANQISLGYDHNLSKRTTLFALYTRVGNDTGGIYGLSTADATSGVVTPGSLGKSPNALSIGMKHSF